ncbi:MAG: stage III sporulation AC/AD family protein [Firmicutes bacterium]|nr:stage III sporulation AC/AD family protein [Bacillota bacterium]
MAELLKIIGVGLIASMATLIVRPVKPEFAVFIAVAGGIVLVIMMFNIFTDVFFVFRQITQLTGIDVGLFSALMQIVGVGFLTEFSANICEDSGNKSLADKIMLGGKIIILVISLPVLLGIVDIVTVLLNT